MIWDRDGVIVGFKPVGIFPNQAENYSIFDLSGAMIEASIHTS